MSRFEIYFVIFGSFGVFFDCCNLVEGCEKVFERLFYDYVVFLDFGILVGDDYFGVLVIFDIIV